MKIYIDKRKVRGVVVEATKAIAGHDFNTLEVVHGLAELIGRTIVGTSKGPNEAADMAALVGEHLARTIQEGLAASGMPPVNVRSNQPPH